MMSFLLYLSLVLVVLWTARVARSKGRSPWIWAGAALLLLLLSNLDLLDIPDLLGLIPMVILMLHKSPVQRTRERVMQRTCPKCADPQSRSPRFCTQCGWELAKPYSEESVAEAEEPKSASVFAESAILEPEVSPVISPTVSPEVSSETAPTADIDPQPAAAQASATEEPSPPVGPPIKEQVPYGVPTPTSLTERGVRLFNQGRTQEAIDQFTKAIALDPTYNQAWARRAEAYALLGRGKKAAEDRRQLDALDASSSTG